MKNALAGILVTKAMESIGTAVKEIKAVGENNRENVTHFLNASHSMGKYHAYMDILKDLNMEQLVKCHDHCKDDCDKVLHGMEKLYQMIGA